MEGSKHHDKKKKDKDKENSHIKDKEGEENDKEKEEKEVQHKAEKEKLEVKESRLSPLSLTCFSPHNHNDDKKSHTKEKDEKENDNENEEEEKKEPNKVVTTKKTNKKEKKKKKKKKNDEEKEEKEAQHKAEKERPEVKESRLSPLSLFRFSLHKHDDDKKSKTKIKKKVVPYQPGLCGLSNLGNTCFMNSALQCLSNTPPLSTYFASGKYKADVNKRNPLGMKGQLADTFGDLMKNMWSGEYKSVAPRTFKRTLGRWAPQFSGFSQNDSQELLAFLLDGLHEDTNRVSRKPYVKAVEGGSRPDAIVAKEAWEGHLKRNKSLVVDLFQGQLKSTVTCPDCHTQSIKFDPFMFLSLPLPNEWSKAVEVVVVVSSGSAKKMPLRYGLYVPRNGTVLDVKRLLSPLCGVPEHELVLANLGDGNRVIQKFMSDATPLSSLLTADSMFFYSLPEIKLPSAKDAEKSRKAKHTEEDEEEEKEEKKKQMKKKKKKSGGSDDDGSKVTMYRVCFVHRSESSKVKSVLVLRGLPFVMDFSSEDTGCTLYEAVWKRYKFMFGRAAKVPPFSSYNTADGEGDENTISEMKTHDYHTKNKANKRMYPFTISCVSYTGRTCGLCKTDCTGCKVRCSRKALPWSYYAYSEGLVYLSVDWCPTCVKNMNIDLYSLGCVSLHESCLKLRKVLKRGTTLNDCMRLFTMEEQLSKSNPWYCPHCKAQKRAFKKISVWKLPEYLIVHLKRFQYTSIHREKLTKAVGFKMKWNLAPFVLSNTDGSDMYYELYAVSYHMGGLGGGHYIACAESRVDGKWYCFNDSHCSKIDESQIQSNSAYVLFYRRVHESNDNSSNGTDDDDNSNTGEDSDNIDCESVSSSTSDESESDSDSSGNERDSQKEKKKPKGDPRTYSDDDSD